MFEFKTKHIINRPIKEVFEFFEKPENLEQLTPTNLRFKILTPKPLVMKEGGIFDYIIKVGIIKFKWKTLIDLYKPPLKFRDVQVIGPYKKWIHTHEFIDLKDSTEIIDTVKYDLSPTFLRNIINRLFIRKKIEQIFSYRKSALEKIFE